MTFQTYFLNAIMGLMIPLGVPSKKTDVSPTGGKPDFYLCAGFIEGYLAVKESCPQSGFPSCARLMNGSYVPDDVPRCISFYPQLKHFKGIFNAEEKKMLLDILPIARNSGIQKTK